MHLVISETDRGYQREVEVDSRTAEPNEATQQILDSLKVQEAEASELGVELNAIANKIYDLPSMERQFSARLAEKGLSESSEGQELLDEVSKAISAMGFGDIPMLTY